MLNNEKENDLCVYVEAGKEGKERRKKRSREWEEEERRGEVS